MVPNYIRNSLFAYFGEICDIRRVCGIWMVRQTLKASIAGVYFEVLQSVGKNGGPDVVA